MTAKKPSRCKSCTVKTSQITKWVECLPFKASPKRLPLPLEFDSNVEVNQRLPEIEMPSLSVCWQIACSLVFIFERLLAACLKHWKFVAGGTKLDLPQLQITSSWPLQKRASIAHWIVTTYEVIKCLSCMTTGFFGLGRIARVSGTWHVSLSSPKRQVRKSSINGNGKSSVPVFVKLESLWVWLQFCKTKAKVHLKQKYLLALIRKAKANNLTKENILRFSDILA